MRQLADLTLPTPEQNLACDEVLLELCECGESPEVLRFWEPTDFFVVVGYANKIATEVDVAFCRGNSIPILRRCSGGGTVLQGPGCLNYSLILRYDSDPALGSIPATNQFVLGRHLTALSRLLETPLTRVGHTDLALRNLKFSGNAQRRRKQCLLFHGTFIVGLDLDLVEKSLLLPSKQPEYRANRTHREFLTTLNVHPARIKEALRDAWEATEPFVNPPVQQIDLLARDKYSRHEWNWKF